MRALRLGDREHALGDVHADDLGRPLLGQVQGELAEPAAEIEHALAVDVWEKSYEVRVLDGARPAGAEALERRVASEEFRVVVDVLWRVAHGRRWLERAHGAQDVARIGAHLEVV